MPINSKANITRNWNKIVLPTEEEILLISPEMALENKDNIIENLLNKYLIGMEKRKSFYSEIKILGKILDKRYAAINAYIDLKKHLAVEAVNKNNDAEDRIKNVKDLIQQLGQHYQYIQKNRKLLEEEASEEHLPPLIFSLIADGFDYLATLQWNLLDSKPKNETLKTILAIIKAYKACIYCLHEEKKLLPKALHKTCDEKLEVNFKRIIDVFDEVKTLKVTLGFSTERCTQLMEFKAALIPFLKNPPTDSITNLFPPECQSLKQILTKKPNKDLFFKKPKISSDINVLQKQNLKLNR